MSPAPSGTVASINWRNVVGCGLLAGVVWIVLGSLATTLLGREFAAVPNNQLGHPTAGFIVFNAILDLLEAISLLWLYAAIRPRFGAGPRTAVVAAVAWWVVVTLGDAAWCSFGFFPASTVIPLILGTLPALIVAALVGARFYRD